jgi:hypothetical protein
VDLPAACLIAVLHGKESFGSVVVPEPPPVREAEFVAVDTADEAEILRRFDPFVRSLHSYLNELPCLSDLQKARRRWKARTAETHAFGNFATDPKHWYTFHHGGRNEAQFNVGLWPAYFRVGLGFEFTLKKGGDPTAVHLAYACFVKMVRSNLSDFEDFVADNQLEVEWADNKGGSDQVIRTDDVVRWLLNPPQEPGWIFVGRLLRRDRDATVLQQPSSLGSVMQAVLSGFRPIWEETEVMAHRA